MNQRIELILWKSKPTNKNKWDTNIFELTSWGKLLYGMSAVAISKIGALGSNLQRCDKNTAWRVSGTKFHHWAIEGTYIIDGKLRRASWKICEII